MGVLELENGRWEFLAFQRKEVVLFRRAGGSSENSCSCSKVKSVVGGLAQRRRLGALSAAGVGAAKGSWLTSFQLEEKPFL